MANCLQRQGCGPLQPRAGVCYLMWERWRLPMEQNSDQPPAHWKQLGSWSFFPVKPAVPVQAAGSYHSTCGELGWGEQAGTLGTAVAPSNSILCLWPRSLVSSVSKQEPDRLTPQLVSRVNLSSPSPQLLALSTQYQSPGVGLGWVLFFPLSLSVRMVSLRNGSVSTSGGTGVRR